MEGSLSSSSAWVGVPMWGVDADRVMVVGVGAWIWTVGERVGNGITEVGSTTSGGVAGSSVVAGGSTGGGELGRVGAGLVDECPNAADTLVANPEDSAALTARRSSSSESSLESELSLPPRKSNLGERT